MVSLNDNYAYNSSIKFHFNLPYVENNHAIELNVASHDSISATLQAVIAKYKRPPTIVVNSAGITRDNLLLKMPEVDFDAVINVNLKVNKQII